MDDLLIKYLLNEAAPGERMRVEQWLSADAGHRQRYEQFRRAWEISGHLLSTPAPDTAQSLQRLKQRMQASAVKPISPATYRFFRPGYAAAVLAGIICIGTLVYLLPGRQAKTADNKKPSAGHTITDTPVGKPAGLAAGWRQVRSGNAIIADTLPDGSIITLHPHTSIRYQPGMEKSGRALRLEGGAFFSVVHNPSRPFLIYVNDIIVKVLGTSFTIHPVAGGTGIEVKSGVVMVSRGADSFVLHTGEMVVVPRKGGNHIKDTGKISPSLPIEPAQEGKKKKIPPGDDASFKRDRQTMLDIINDLVKEKIIPGKDSLLWFALTSRQLVVDGKDIPGALHALFRSRYLRPDGHGYYYGPVKVYGPGVYMEKKDLD